MLLESIPLKWAQLPHAWGGKKYSSRTFRCTKRRKLQQDNSHRSHDYCRFAPPPSPTPPLSCPAGKSTTGDDATDHDSVDDCTECGVGKYSGEGEACSDCSTSQYSEAGSPSCSDCSAGKRIIEGGTGGESSVCTNCASGKFSPAGASICTSCDAGKYR